MSRGKRYDGEKKLNLKKVFAVILVFIVLIMFVIVIQKLLTAKPAATSDKVSELNYYAVYTKDKWGVIDGSGKTIIEPTYEEMIVIPDSTKPVFLCTEQVDYQAGTYHTKVLNEKNEEIINGYDQVESIQNYDASNNMWYEKNVLRVKKGDKYGLVDFTGKTLLAYEYDSIEALKGTSNSLLTQKDGKYGLVDNTGKVIIPNEYKQILAISDKYENGYIVVNDENKYGIIGYNTKTVVEPRYDEIKPIYGNNLYVVKEGDTWKIANAENPLFDLGQNEVQEINSGNIIISNTDGYGIINSSGEEVIPATYQDLSYAFGEYYIAKKDDKYGIINLKNETKVDFTYTSLVYRKDEDFLEGSKDDITSDLLNHDFEIKVTGILSEVNTERGYLKVRVGDEYQYYNFKFEPKQSTEVYPENTLFLSKKDGKYGYVDKNGVVVVNYIYEDAMEQNKYGFAAVKKDGKWGAIDKEGKEVAPLTHSMENNLIIDFIGKYHLAEDINANYYTDAE